MAKTELKTKKTEVSVEDFFDEIEDEQKCDVSRMSDVDEKK